MNNNPPTAHSDEISLSLSDILWSILSCWRRIILVTVAAALLVGGVYALLQTRKLSDSSYVTSAKEKNAELQTAYEQDKARLNALKEYLRSQIQYQADFAQTPVFQISPYAANTMKLVFFASADENKGDTDGTTSSLSLAVLNAYRARIAQVDIMGIMFPDSPTVEDNTFDLGGALMIPLVDLDFHTMEVTIVGPGPEHLAAASAEIDRIIAEAGPEIAEKVGPHTFSKLSESTCVTQSDALILLHTDYEKRMDILMDKYTDVTTEISKLKSPSTAVVKKSQVLRSSVKKAVIGALAGFVLAVGWIFVSVALTGKVLSVKDLTNGIPVRFLGSIHSGSGKTGPAGGLDRLIAARQGMLAGKTAEEETDFIAANLQCAAGQVNSVVLIGGAHKAVMEELSRELSKKLQGMQILCGGDLLSDADAVRAYQSCEGVILVETLCASRWNQVISSYSLAAGDGKKILGAILSGK